MATIPYQLLVDKPRLKVIMWETLTETNADGAPYVFSGFYPEKHAQIIGSFGTGGKIALQGAGHPTTPTWQACLDATEDALLDLAAAGWKTVLTNPYQFRPFVSAGSSVDLDVILVLKS